MTSFAGNNHHVIALHMVELTSCRVRFVLTRLFTILVYGYDEERAASPRLRTHQEVESLSF